MLGSCHNPHIGSLHMVCPQIVDATFWNKQARILTKRHDKYSRGSSPFFHLWFPWLGSGAGNMEGDPALMTEWKVLTLLSHAVICMLQQGNKPTNKHAMHLTGGQRRKWFTPQSPWPGLDLASYSFSSLSLWMTLTCLRMHAPWASHTKCSSSSSHSHSHSYSQPEQGAGAAPPIASGSSTGAQQI
jgi:hypothetical protein